MTYSEFKNQNAWMIKNYSGTDRIFSDDMEQIIGTYTKESFIKSGSHWKQITKEINPLSREIYCNIVNAVPFFRNLGGYERIECSYTMLAYLPIKINSISPDRNNKVTCTFSIKY